MSEVEKEEEIRIIGDKNSYKYIVYTVDGTEFHLDEFNEFNASGFIGNDIIKFHPEAVMAVRTRL